eukprot:CAMPEP_0185028304 /NCGR_PEP_ID=MMETSP1103-20130426/13948_1 /TAXON_ID=36769 /ORGANISM="Paraphysomonas bandaiensis, Strain Caron Lab Isolate" /LENGTH=1753 /DNA_ID=CAMNT_0027562681 /DNA_START=94 /DNA_END=5355 /DNA_ORIENTATION=-
MDTTQQSEFVDSSQYSQQVSRDNDNKPRELLNLAPTREAAGNSPATGSSSVQEVSSTECKPVSENMTMTAGNEGHNTVVQTVPTSGQRPLDEKHSPQISAVQPYISSLPSVIQGNALPSKGNTAIATMNSANSLLSQSLQASSQHGQSRMGQIYSTFAGSSIDAMNGQQFSIPTSGGNSIGQPQLLHLQHHALKQDNGSRQRAMDAASAGNNALPNSKMLLSQPGLVHHGSMRQPEVDMTGSQQPNRLSYGSSPILSQNMVMGGANGRQQHPSYQSNVKQSNQRWSGSGQGSKSWHKVEHSEERNLMNRRIVDLLQQRRPHASNEWHLKLPQMAKRLEEALYSDASSYEEYKDSHTLKTRLQQLAQQMGNKNSNRAATSQNSQALPERQPSHTGLLHSHMHPSAQHVHGGGNPSTNGPPHAGANNMHAMRGVPPSRPQTAGTYPPQTSSVSTQKVNSQPFHNRPMSGMPERPGTSMPMTRVEVSVTATPSVQTSTTSTQPTSSARQFIKMAQINPRFNNTVHSKVPPHQESSRQATMPQSFQHKVAPTAHEQQKQAQQGDYNLVSSQQNKTSYKQAPRQNPSGSQHSEAHKKQVLRQQQQRLLLLRHASKCPHEESCQVTPHCKPMKELWKHIMGCKDQNCKTPHCVSSRYVLSHYSKCKEQNCPVCGPVRDAIRKNYDKSVKVANNLHSGMAVASSVPKASQPDVVKKEEPSEPLAKRARNDPISKSASTLPHTDKLDNVSCAIYSFTNDQINAHLSHLHEGMRFKSSDIRDICMPLIEDILRHPSGYIFSKPVDPEALGIPDYPTIIKNPMDIGTVRKRLESGYYRDIQELAADVRLCFDNAMTYNARTSDVHACAAMFKSNFDKGLKSRLDRIERENKNKRENTDACALCGEICLKFEPPNIYCNGTCNNQRIRRNSFYYVGKGSYHWCPSCYNDLKDPIKLVNNGVLYKKDLQKKKHTEESEESWVQCDVCRRWVHQICALFNGRRNLSEEMLFMCPTCILDMRKKDPAKAEAMMVSPLKKTQAADLPRCMLSEYIENSVNKCLERAYQEQAQKLSVPYSEVEKAPPITVRQVSSIDQAHRTREGVYERYRHKNYPAEFPCRTKCILLFQNIDGQDVILFGMYVYEYGHKCPQPNQRRVYISYLDSVHYFRPRQYRTAVYHEILVSYLEYVKKRGFHTAHIWACPPMKGDDYIFNCHPPDQKTPKDDRLRLWYVRMLERCKERGIIHEIVDMYTEYMQNPNNDATVLPYFEGDYWVGEAENIIKRLKVSDESGDGAELSDSDDDGARVRSKRKKTKSTTKRNVRPRLSRSGTSSRPQRDAVMAKLSAIIEPMKEAFFVVRLHPKEYAEKCAAMQREELAKEERENKKGDEGDKDEAVLSGKAASTSMSTSVSIKNETGAIPKSEKPVAEAQSSISTPSVASETKLDSVKNADDATAVTITEEPKISGTGDNSKHPKLPTENGKSTGHEVMSSSDPVATIEQNSNAEKVGSQEPVDATVSEDANGKPSGSTQPIAEVVVTPGTEDDDDTQDSEHFESRLSFLNLCQGNHYQFDQLRRAKHTSLMTLYHLHNPDAPKFIPHCVLCTQPVLQGFRHHCETCDNDICQSCYDKQEPRHCSHPLRRMVVTGGAPAQQLTEEQRRERQKYIAFHLKSLQHAAYCGGCESQTCARMKNLLKHTQECRDGGLKQGCHNCKRIYSLLTLHARNCKLDTCRVLKCKDLKDTMRKNAMKQQQMDDRRRQMMNDMYRGNQK